MVLLAKLKVTWDGHAIPCTKGSKNEIPVLSASIIMRQGVEKKTEENFPTLEADIHHLVQEQSQVDPTFRSTLSSARLSARAVREALLQEKGYGDHELPSRQTIGSILNR